jgi:hypothetical protein
LSARRDLKNSDHAGDLKVLWSEIMIGRGLNLLSPITQGGAQMIGSHDAWRQVAQECPRRIISTLHSHGHYIHVTSARFPGKVLCIHRDGTLPADWTPTPAQEEAWQSQQQDQIAAT